MRALPYPLAPCPPGVPPRPHPARALLVKVAFVTPEFQLLVRRSNLAGAAQDLAVHLHKAGADVRVFIPSTKGIDLEPLTGLESRGEVAVEDVSEGRRRTVRFGVREARLGELPIYLIEHPRLFAERFPYGDENGPYVDNWHRYHLFCKAVLAAFDQVDFEPDVLHGIDWTAGMLPLVHQLACETLPEEHFLRRAGTFFSVLNLAMQGEFEREVLPKMGIPHAYFKHTGGVEHAGKVNFLKAGIEFATVVGTHSPNHAQVIQTQDRGYGLEESFERRKKELVGIHNGIDYEAWDPAKDPLIPANFSSEDRTFGGKKKCKASLQEGLQLDKHPDALLACHIGRWDADSGFDLLAEVLGSVLERDIELVVMGAGGEEITRRLKTIQGTFVGRMRALGGYDQAAAHRLMAGADLLLLPSHYQPSNPLFAIGLRYGVVPLVYAQGGLEDAVPDATGNGDDGLGFHFSPYTGDGLLGGIVTAHEHFQSSKKWNPLVRRALAQDFSWEHTAGEYLKAYRRVTRRVRGR